MNQKSRAKDLGLLFIVGGPGGSGSSTIAEMLSKHFSLQRVYGGAIFRDFLKEYGYTDNDKAFFEFNQDLLISIDKRVDEKLRKESQKPNVLIESKIFSALATIEDIPTTVRIWITADLHTRSMRSLYKLGFKSIWQNIPLYLKNRLNLHKRYLVDKARYKNSYGIKYDCPEEYNDIVIDSSHMNEKETFELILKYIKDGRYIK